MDEHASAMASRREVRDSLDEYLDTRGAELVAILLHRDGGESRRAAAVDDPANESGARALMAMAGGST